MLKYTNIITNKTPLYEQIIAHMKVSNEKFILPDEPLIDKCDEMLMTKIRALYFAMIESERKDLFLRDLHRMILPNYKIKNYYLILEFLCFGGRNRNNDFFDERLIIELGMSACYFCRHGANIAPIKYGLMALGMLDSIFKPTDGEHFWNIFIQHTNISEIFKADE